jgi:hypothetical protein
MVLGAVWCPTGKVRESAVRLREIRQRHRLPPNFEFKWTKVGPAKIDFYRDVLDYFFDDDDLRFRGVIIDKTQLNHAAFGQCHDDWYYNMWFTLLERLLHPEGRHRVYLDIKDTRSQQKVEQLRQRLCDSRLDFHRDPVERIQQVRSHQVVHVQLADLIAGAVAAANRDDLRSEAKLALVRRMQERSRLSLRQTTLSRAEKVNLLQWQGSGQP